MPLSPRVRRALGSSFALSDPFASSDGGRWIAKVRGPLAVAVLILFLEVLSWSGFGIPHVDSFLLLLVAYVAFVDGVAAGLAAAGLAVAYFAYAVSPGGRIFHATVFEWEQVVIVGAAVPSLAVLVGLLRSRLEHANARARDATERLSAVVEGLPTGFFIVDGEGRPDYVNGRAAALLGSTGRGGFWRGVSAALGETALERIQRATRLGEPTSFEAPHEATGAWFDVQVHPLPAGGAAACLVDVTERKRIREQDQAIRRMESIAHLSGGLAHDFNNLLTAISGYTDLALTDMRPDDPRRSSLDEVQKAAAHASELTHQLLAYSRLQLLRPRILDPDALVAGLEPRIRERAGSAIEVRISMGADGVPIRADREQLEDVVLQLVDRAAGSMPGGGRLEITTGRTTVEEPDDRGDFSIEPGEYAVLTVTDTGAGMDAETRRRIFEPFSAAGSAGPGGGLGLATAYGVVKQSGGYLLVDDGPGGGTVFRVCLPRVEGVAVEEASTAPAPPAPATAPEGTILVVENDEAVRNLAASVLRRSGYRVVDVADAEAALAAAEDPATIDLLFADVVLPGMSGRKLARELVERRPGLPVVYTSGYTSEHVIQGGIARGVLEGGIEFLHKPYSPDELVDRIASVMATRAVPDAAGAIG